MIKARFGSNTYNPNTLLEAERPRVQSQCELYETLLKKQKGETVTAVLLSGYKVPVNAFQLFMPLPVFLQGSVGEGGEQNRAVRGE